MFTVVRENVAKGYGRKLTPRWRGLQVWHIETSIKKAASSIGLGINIRTVRLALASEAFERQIATFNQLSTDELIALVAWAGTKKVVVQWLTQRYGASERLPGL